VYDRALGQLLWQTCDNSVLRFSPDGRLLLASGPYLDGLGLSSLSVLDVSTGAPMVTFTIRGGFISQWGWEDSSHPLVVVSGPAGWEILRLGLDGTRQRAVGPVTPDRDPTLRVLTLPGDL
jgi:WD40 repeat protein